MMGFHCVGGSAEDFISHHTREMKGWGLVGGTTEHALWHCKNLTPSVISPDAPYFKGWLLIKEHQPG